MKLKAIAALCKAAEQYFLYDNCPAERDPADGQWIGTQAAVYLTQNLPHLTEDTLQAMWDIPKKKWNLALVSTSYTAPEWCSTVPNDPGDLSADLLGISINVAGEEIFPLQTDAGLLFVEEKYLRPIADELGEITLVSRAGYDEQPILAAKKGTNLVALIRPRHLEKETKTVQRIRALAAGLGGVTCVVDPATGELVEK